jgi:iron complex outermembrane receptor protein
METIVANQIFALGILAGALAFAPRLAYAQGAAAGPNPDRGAPASPSAAPAAPPAAPPEVDGGPAVTAAPSQPGDGSAPSATAGPSAGPSPVAAPLATPPPTTSPAPVASPPGPTAEPAVVGAEPPPAGEEATPKDRSSSGRSELDTLVVTGVRGGPPRTVAQSPAPIDVISGDTLAKTGRAELGEAIAKVLPSLSFGTNEGGITTIVRPVINRGLGPGYTLVLINGKRRHNGSFITNGGGDTSGVNPVDLDLIPTSAIDYIEVLKDSAAAQYGSDAVAGVINIVFKKDSEGGRFGVQAGRLYDGTGDKNADRAEADAGFRVGKGFLHLSADASYRGLVWNNFYASQVPYAPANNPQNAYWNGDGAHNGDPQIGLFNLSYNFQLPVDAVTLYSFGTFGVRSTVIGNNYRRPDSAASFSSVFPEGYYPLNNTSEYDYQFVAGAKGVLWGANVDLSSSYGRNRQHQYSDFTINPSLGPNSPQSFPNMATYLFDQWVQNLDVTKSLEVGLPKPLQISGGVEVRTEHFQTFAGDPDTYVNGGYIFQPGDQQGDPNVGKPASVGAQAGVSITPDNTVSLTRNVVAGYLDSGIYPIKEWYNGVAVRLENYSDSGTTFGGKLNSRIDVLEQLAFRGTIGSGFRAPSLTQIGYSEQNNRTNTNPLTGVVSPSLSLLVPTTSPLARALGAQDLKPERSVNFGLGTVITPFKKFNITVDGYEIDIKDRIGRTTALLGPAIAPLLQQYGHIGTEYVQYFANQADTRTRGVDIVGEYSHDFRDAGFLLLSAGFNYNVTEITRVVPTPAALAAFPQGAPNSLTFFGRAAAGDLTVNLPKDKLILTVKYQLGPVRVTVWNTRYGPYDYVRSQIVSQDTHYGPRWLTDVDVTYTTKEGFEFGVGANNVFDVYPSKNGIQDPATGSSGLVYGPAPFAPTGGFYYGKLAYNF